jgi:hypothetical protein
MNTKQEINDDKLWTSCKDCVFAVYENNTQCGCSTGRLEKFKDVGTHIVEAQDGEKEYMVIERFCNHYREKNWMTNSKPVRSWGRIKNKEKTVKKETQIRCGVIIILKNIAPIQDDDFSERIAQIAANELTVENMEKTILACLKQKEVKPDYIVVVNSSEVPHTEIISRMHHTIKKKAVFYAVRTSHNEASLEECIDLAFAQAKNGHYIVFEGGYEPPPNFLDKINSLINEELQPILLLKPQNKIDGMFVQTMIHKMLGGNAEKPLIDKIDKITKEENTEHLIRKWEDILDD